MSYYVKVRGVLKALVRFYSYVIARKEKRLIQALIGNFLWLFFPWSTLGRRERKKERLNMRRLSRSRGTEGGEKESPTGHHTETKQISTRNYTERNWRSRKITWFPQEKNELNLLLTDISPTLGKKLFLKKIKRGKTRKPPIIFLGYFHNTSLPK